MSKLKSLQIIFHNGEPDGIRTYMKRLSIMKTYVVPRSCLKEARSITGIENPGIYYLINDESGSLTEIYIGQTREGINRMADHNAHKDFWNKALLFLGDSEHFTLSILSGLEKYAIKKALESNRYNVLNKVDPRYHIEEYDLPVIEEIYEEIEFIVATLGYGMINRTKDSDNVFKTSRRGVVAFGIYQKETFDVLPDSEIDFSHKVDLNKYNEMREIMLRDGTIEERDGKYYLTKILSFKSPSGASDFVLGGSTNGWNEWKKDGKTLDDVYRKNEN